MTFQAGHQAALLVNQFDLSRFFREVSPGADRDLLDATTFGHTSRVYVPALRAGRLSASGLFDAEAVLGADVVLDAALGATADRVVTEGPAGAAVGSRAWLMQGHAAAYEINSAVEDLTSIMAEITGDSALEGGVFLADPAASIAAAGSNVTGASVDHGAATSNGAVGHLHGVTIDGTTPSLTVKIQHSSDGSVWADLITFSGLTAEGSQRLEVAGTVNRYTRALYTLTGSGLTVAYAAALARR